MAIIQCRDCKREVSTMATSCQSCGRPVYIEPTAWPQGFPMPQSSTGGPSGRWYLSFVLAGEDEPRAAIVESVSRKDMLDFLHAAMRNGAARFNCAKPTGSWDTAAKPPVDMDALVQQFGAERAREQKIGMVGALIIVSTFVFAFIKLIEWALRK